MIHPFKYEEQEMVNISTGHKAKSADLVRARGIGIGTDPVAAGETGNEKVSTQNWSHLQKSSCFVNLLFPNSTVLRFVYLERYHARQTGFFSRMSEWGPPHSEKFE